MQSKILEIYTEKLYVKYKKNSESNILKSFY